MKANNTDTVRELTRKERKTGKVYTRDCNTESQIRELNSLGFSEILQRIKVRGTNEHVKNETLVYMIRDSARPDSEREKFLYELLERCKFVVKKIIINKRIQNPDELCQDIIQEFAVLFSADWNDIMKNELDFYECRFNLAFKGFINYQLRGDLLRAVKEHSIDFTIENETINQLRKVAASGSELWQMSDTELQVIFKQMLREFTDDEMNAFVLCEIIGYTQKEAADKLNVSDKTIRNRLDKVRKILEVRINA